MGEARCEMHGPSTQHKDISVFSGESSRKVGNKLSHSCHNPLLPSTARLSFREVQSTIPPLKGSRRHPDLGVWCEAQNAEDSQRALSKLVKTASYHLPGADAEFWGQKSLPRPVARLVRNSSTCTWSNHMKIVTVDTYPRT